MALADKARGQNIARLRKRKRLTQQALAERLGLGYRTVQMWEAGTMPEWPNLEKLALALGVKPEEIIGDEEPAPAVDRLERIERAQQQILDRLQAIMDRLGIPPDDGDAEPVDPVAQAEAVSALVEEPAEGSARGEPAAAGSRARSGGAAAAKPVRRAGTRRSGPRRAA